MKIAAIRPSPTAARTANRVWQASDNSQLLLRPCGEKNVERSSCLVAALGTGVGVVTLPSLCMRSLVISSSWASKALIRTACEASASASASGYMLAKGLPLSAVLINMLLNTVVLAVALGAIGGLTTPKASKSSSCSPASDQAKLKPTKRQPKQVHGQ